MNPPRWIWWLVGAVLVLIALVLFLSVFDIDEDDDIGAPTT